MSSTVGAETTTTPDFDAIRWYAAHTKANQEWRVLRNLQNRAVEVFLPVCLVRRKRHNRSVEMESPLFPGYVFVRIPYRERLRVLTLAGVSRIVGSATAPAHIPDTEVLALIEGARQKRYADPYRNLAVGTRVRLTSGPFEGLEGTLLRNKKNARVIVTISAIASSFAIEVERTEMEPVRQTRSGNELRAHGVV